ncbi:MAG: SAM-dependent methyltransferase [Firmicutes bacterium]|nr:SAM-dependent methyltransferase [Bacillota bacterium]
MSERYTEEFVLKEMGVQLGENEFGYIFPQGDIKSGFDTITTKLRAMGGKPVICNIEDYDTVGNGKAKPEYIATFSEDKSTILLIECKRSTKEHISPTMNMPQKYAVDGALFYAKHLKEDYNVLAVAVSGTTKDNVKVNTFYWKKGFETPQELKKAKDTILEPLNYLNLANGKKLERKFSLQEIREMSLIMHEKLRQIKISEKDKPIFIAGILIGLQNADFRNTWNDIKTFKPLVDTLIGSIEQVLDNSNIRREKIDSIKTSFRKVKTNEKLKALPLGESGSLAWFIEQLEMRILPMMNHYEYTEDALSIFYHEFIKYSGGDGKGLGIVLTPKHLTEFMCDLGEVNKNSKVIDICCGSASFLITAMAKMCKEANATEIENIKKTSLYGVELDIDLYTLAITNMIIRKDGKSNIIHGDCFSAATKKELESKQLSLGLINPPYAQEDKSELEFVEQLLNYLVPRGLAVAVVPMSCAIGTKFKEIRQKLFKNHTLKAVFSMPDDIFYPTGVNVCVMVWEAHKPHDSTKPTFFGYCKDDGFVKRKKMGRIDYFNRWDDIKKEWLDLYEGKKVVDGKSALQCVTADDEWLCEAYMKTDYSKITQNNFEQTVRDYLAYLVKNGGNNES